MTGNEDMSVAERAQDRISMETVERKSERAAALAAIWQRRDPGISYQDVIKKRLRA
jgi:hypothetical protein